MGLKELKKAVKEAQFEHDEWSNQLAIAKQMHADNPSDDSKEVLDLCENGLADAEHKLEQALARLAPLQDQLPEEPQEVKAPEPELPKFDPQNHPVLKKSIEKTEETPAVALRTGDMCEAFWRDDRKWYKAKILTILGSASNPQYKVKFVEYSDTPTLERDQVRPLTVHQHKKKQEEPAAAPAAPVTSTPHVISAPAVANPKAIATPEIMSDAAPAKKRNIPNRKTLDKSVGSWKDWNSKGVGKKIAQKESMFRSGTTVESRVGFTGSGAGMTQSTKRVRPNNKALAEADEDEERPNKSRRYEPELVSRSHSSGKRF